MAEPEAPRGLRLIGCFLSVHPVPWSKQTLGQAHSQWGGDMGPSVPLGATAQDMHVKSYCRDKELGGVWPDLPK